MPVASCCYYLNSLFDLELGGFPTAKVERFAAELSVLFLCQCNQGDGIVLGVDVQEEYFSYLAENGIVSYSGSTLHHGEIEQKCLQYDATVCWGWNSTLAARVPLPVRRQYPAVDVVAKVNNRRFCSMLSRRYATGVPGSRCVTDVEEFDRVVHEGNEEMFPLVVKPLFGSSGYGLKVFLTSADFERCRTVVREYCCSGGCVIEPWCTRDFDIGCVTTISRMGNIEEPLCHRQLVNRFGAFYGVYIDNNDAQLACWKQMLDEVVCFYGAAVAEEGYFGPLGIDSFVYRSRKNDARQCAAGIEINGRWTMGHLAHHIRRKIRPDRCMLMRFLGQRTCQLPPTYTEWDLLLGKYRFDVASGEGIVLLSPLRSRFQLEWRQPRQSVFAVFGENEDSVLHYDDFLKKAVRRR